MTTIYLDSAASTRVDERVIARMTEVMRAAWANPSAAHPAGADARRWLAQARAEVDAALGGGGEVVFTSGATEADALAVVGAARARGRGRVIVSAFEHAAVGATARALMDDGFEVIEIGATAAGVIDLDALDRALDGDTAVVAMLAVQNELGTVQPIAEIVRHARARAPGAHVHLDAAQALGKVPLDAAALGADSIAVAAHKLGGPKGTGALWLAPGARLVPLWRGGGQERG
ncbi:MAG: aminotransferase class V-fold PLP-dependent enzyme, partial [Deltaproteobacteria bacterium]|nr:aminotransferase class V-fold PLP-dependent enzyme [Deltaproteobacteria bacterium]